MKIYLVEMEYSKWNDDVEFLIVRARTRKHVREMLKNNIEIIGQKIEKIRILGFSLKYKISGIIKYAYVSDA